MSLSRILYYWAKCDATRQQQLQDWFDTAIEQCAQNMGSNLASVTANGVSTAFMSNSLTIVQWLEALKDALELINNPKQQSRKAIQVFR